MHNFSTPRIPQQNGVVERKNRTLHEMARTMLNENGLSKYFWAEAVNTACYVVNMTHIHCILKRTPYKLWKGRLPNISYFHAFGCKCFVHNNGKETLGKFDAKSDKGIFLCYSSISKAYIVFNKILRMLRSQFMLFLMKLTVLCLMWMMMMLAQILKTK